MQIHREEHVPKLRRIVILAAVVLFFLTTLLAITVVPVELNCPVCGTKNTLEDYASWGGYVYQYKSKYQMVFFPYTWSTTVYYCKHCHLSVFMWDWRDFPKDKVEATQKALADVTTPGKYEKYTDVPMSEKLKIAEKVYRVLGRDDAFWANFYRVLGYHLDIEKHFAEAKVARTQSLELTEKFLADPAKKDQRKEYLVWAASLHHFLGNDEAALQDLKSASELKWVNPHDKDKSTGYDQYLSELIADYTSRIKAGTVPRDYSSE